MNTLLPQHVALVWLSIGLWGALGCAPRERISAVESADAASATGRTPLSTEWEPDRESLPTQLLAGKVEIRRGAGEEVYSFRPQDANSCKFCDATGTEICRLTMSVGRLLVNSPADQPLFELKAKDDKLMLKDAREEKELFKFKFKGDTIDCYLPGDTRVYRIKRQEYGWRVENNRDQTLFRAKSSDGKQVLRDQRDQTVLYSHDLPSPLGLVFFEFEELTIEQRASCCAYFLDK